MVSLLGTLVLSIFLFVYVDWKQLVTCRDEDTCLANFGQYLHKEVRR